MDSRVKRLVIGTGTAMVLFCVLISSNVAARTANAAGGNTFTRVISPAIPVAPRAAVMGSPVYQEPEIPTDFRAGNGPDTPGGRITNRSRATYDSSAAVPTIDGVDGPAADPAKTKPLSFEGLTHFDQRYADSGNQFSLVPPDQGLCAGNGFILESVNDALQVYDTTGAAKTGVLSLNQFYGYPPNINRTTHVYGPEPTDPSCYYDPETQRWFSVILTLAADSATGANTGQNFLDIAVSPGSDPTVASNLWSIYHIDVTDDGTNGTPNHNCDPGSGTPLHPNACIGDYPHLGADANGFYVTTNEYSFFGNNYPGAQVYAISKTQLEAGGTITVTQFNTSGMVGGNPGFTLAPATSPTASNTSGTEYFLSSVAAPEANGNGSASSIVLWALDGTGTLATTPALTLYETSITSEAYAVPPSSTQKKGNTPLAACINNTKMVTTAGKGCWNLLFAAEPAHNEVEYAFDSSDTRMFQVSYANGKLAGALDTSVAFKGKKGTFAGFAYFVVTPSLSGSTLTGTINKQGYFGVKGQNTTYPAIGLKANGTGIVGFTLAGKSYFPSAAWTTFDETVGTGVHVNVSGKGKGPYDAFDGYKAYAYNRPRWGDYGASAVVGNTIYVASEYIASNCTLSQFVKNTAKSPTFTCGMTRSALANWSTHITGITQ